MLSLPSAAVSAAIAGDTILVHPGTYQESGTILINKAGLRILGDNPSNTKVTHLPQVGGGVALFQISAGSVEIAGLTITGKGDGIYINSITASIHNNHIRNNGGSGITSTSLGDNFVAFNNLVLNNSINGIFGNSSAGDLAYSNIVAGNNGYGIRDVNSNYNSSYSNGTNYYNANGMGNISNNCLFVDEVSPNPDYRLQSISLCKDAGNSGYLDIDGTRSDMGSFGGPAATLFWPYGDGGPVVTNLTVDPPYVPEGGNISIKATVEIG